MADTAYVIMCYTPGDEPEVFSDVDSVALTEEAAKREVAERTAALREGSESYYVAIGIGVVGDPTEDEQRRERIATTDKIYEIAMTKATELFGSFAATEPEHQGEVDEMLYEIFVAFVRLRNELKGLGY